MKTKKRHQSSSDDSEESKISLKLESSSASDSDDSSASEHRHRKRRKHAESSDSISDSNNHKKSKKRKHKKKKKKHGKKKRRSESEEESDSVEELSSASEGEISPKKKRKHKHKYSKRARSSSASQSAEKKSERRLQSVVKERRESSVEGHPRTYYQKEYHHSPPEVFDREREVERFYRGSSKDRRQQYQDNYHHERERIDRYAPFNQDTYGTLREKFEFHEDNEPRLRYYDDYKRNHRYEETRHHGDYHKKLREENYIPREVPKGFNRYNQYDERGPKRRDIDNGRDFRERPGPPEPEPYRPKEYPEKRDRYRQDEILERSRPPDARRDRPQMRPDKRPPSPPMERVKEERLVRERRNDREERGDRAREERVDRAREERVDRPRDERGDRAREERVERPREERGDRPREERVDRPREERVDRPREERPDRPREERIERLREERAERSKEERGSRFREDSGGRDKRGGRVEGRPERKSNFRDEKPRERKSRFDGENNKEYSWGKTEVKKEEDKEDKEKPNFGLSGKLTAEANTVNGVVIKYAEPDDAKQPKRRWRFYPFKGDKALPILYIHRQSCFLIGRDKKVVDISLDHPSISKQHSVLQFRATPFTRQDGSTGRRVRPYVIDLDSANGTFVNNKKIDPRRYVELLERDVVKFGFSLREYVLLHENSKDDAQDDDHHDSNEIGANVTTAEKVKQEKRVKQEVTEDGE